MCYGGGIHRFDDTRCLFTGIYESEGMFSKDTRFSMIEKLNDGNKESKARTSQTQVELLLYCYNSLIGLTLL